MTTRNGLLLVDKPSGVTSHDVVAKVRRTLDERRVGHAGTLDPLATGLLILGVGPSTRLLRFAQGEPKRYTGVVTLGASTDTLDADGVVQERAAVPALSAEVVNERAASMLGAQLQVPPMVSALKVSGQRLHALARAGVEVERAARSITVTSFSLSPTARVEEWTFDVTCSPGTYVRVLVSDLAEGLGTLGHLSALRRVSSGAHDVNDALTFDELTARVGRNEEVLEPPSSFVQHLEAVVVTREDAQRLRRGQRVNLSGARGEEIAALDDTGSLVAVCRRRDASYQPAVVMASDGEHEPG
jgi:tRNA pseudouridine55 synthase